jgi:5-methylthioribose kinase
MPAAELNIEDRAALERYLQSQFSPAEEFEVREFEILTGGVSGRTVRVSLSGGQEWVLKQALPKLRVEADWFADPRRIHREALGMKVLAELTPPGSIPKLIFDDETHHVLGMEAVPRPHENWKTMLLAGRVNTQHASQFGELLAQIHDRSLYEEDFQKAFDDRSYFESLRLEPYYEFGAKQEPRAATFLSQLIGDTLATRIALVHGDYSPKNVLIHSNRVVLLDHEVIHWGDPAFDVGFALSHFLSKSHHVQTKRQEFVQLADAFWTSYHTKFIFPRTLFDALDTDYMTSCARHTLGCLLARVVGRSPLEYLTTNERDRQREAVVRLIDELPSDPSAVMERFVQEIER